MKCQRQKFRLQRKQAYFNCAYMSPLMKKVEKAGIYGVKRKSKPYQIHAEDFFKEPNEIRSLFSRLIDNPEPNRVALIPSASYGIANVVRNMPYQDGEVLLCYDQFPSNVYPWWRLRESGVKVKMIGPPDSLKRGESWNERILSSISAETRAVSIGHVHWSDGTLFNLEAIREKLNTVGGLLIVDGTQSVGALPFSVQKIRPDALICAAYKWLMGPYSIGLAYYGPAFDDGVPIEDNWTNRVDSDNFSGLANYQEEYREFGIRYDVGEKSNFILLPMLKAALKQLLKWKHDNIQDYTKMLMSDAIDQMLEWGYQIEDSNYRSNHLFGVRLPQQVDSNLLQQAFQKHRISISLRGNAIRVSPNVYNDEMDVRKLLKAMKEPIFASKH